MRYWINTVSRDHNHNAFEGKEARAKRLAKGDSVVFYAPRGDQHFTAIAEVVGDAASELRFLTASEVPVKPLIEELDFIRNKKSWGVSFRRGFFEIGEGDFQRIAAAMACGGSTPPCAANGSAGRLA